MTQVRFCVYISFQYKEKPEDAEAQEFNAEGLTARLAKTKAVEKLLKQLFGPDHTKTKEREITSIKGSVRYTLNLMFSIRLSLCLHRISTNINRRFRNVRFCESGSQMQYT